MQKQIFNRGDAVWIQNPALIDNIDQAREIQEVESIDLVQCDEGPIQSINLIGLPYIYLEKDLKHVEEQAQSKTLKA